MGELAASLLPGEAIECFNPNSAVMKAEALSRKRGRNRAQPQRRGEMAGVGAFTAKSPRIEQRHQSEQFRWRAPMLEMIWMPFSFGTGTPHFALSWSVNARDHPTSLVASFQIWLSPVLLLRL